MILYDSELDKLEFITTKAYQIRKTPHGYDSATESAGAGHGLPKRIY